MQSPLYAYKAHLVDAFLNSVYNNDDGVRLTALEGLQQMISLKQFLSQEEVGKGDIGLYPMVGEGVGGIIHQRRVW